MDARWRHWQGSSRQRAAVRQWPCSSPPQLVRPVGAVLVNGGTEQCLLSVSRGCFQLVSASAWGALLWPPSRAKLGKLARLDLAEDQTDQVKCSAGLQIRCEAR